MARRKSYARRAAHYSRSQVRHYSGVARGAISSASEDLLLLGGIGLILYFTLKGSIGSAASATGQALQTVGQSSVNAINYLPNLVAQLATGNPSTSVGSTLYDWDVSAGYFPDAGAAAAADTIIDPATGRAILVWPGTSTPISQPNPNAASWWSKLF